METELETCPSCKLKPPGWPCADPLCAKGTNHDRWRAFISNPAPRQGPTWREATWTMDFNRKGFGYETAGAVYVVYVWVP
jgi:hypothetical protein